MSKLLVGFHFAKTGGSTLSGHLNSTFGHDAVIPFGTATRVQRFFEGRCVVEEMAPEEFANARMLYGHGVTENTLHCLPDGIDVDFVFLTRDPVKLYKSRKVHATQARQRFQNEANARVRFKGSPLASALCARFPSFANEGAEALDEKAVSILRSFRFALSTDTLDAQMPGLMAWLGAPLDIEARRVRNAGARPVNRTLEKLLASESVVDRHINDTVMTGTWEPASESLNAFGFDPAHRDLALRRLRERRPPREAIVHQGYAALVNALKAQGCLHAALAFLDAGKAGVRDPRYLESRVRSALKGRELSQKEILQRADIFLRLGNAEAARQDIEALGDQTGLGAEGHRIAATVYLRSGRPALAREHAEEALRIAPDDARSAALRKRATGLSGKVHAVAYRLAALSKGLLPGRAYKSPSARNEQ